jgi:exodeoxyribonuclease III
VLLLQEVRASDEHLADALEAAGLGHLHVAHTEASARGRAGVAVLTTAPQDRVTIGPGAAEFADSGRWVEVDVDTPLGPLTAVSVYVHTGEAETPREDEKLRFLAAMDRRMTALRRRAARRGGHVLVGGDLNVAHTEMDIKNWRGNRGKAGFLPEERTYLDRWLARGTWVDLGRSMGGPGPGPYTWWSWRGRGFDTDGGWRIDYQLATAGLAARARSARVDKAPTYAQRWSDHAPLIVEFA